VVVTQTQGKVALISVHGDPSVEIGKEEAGGQNVYVRYVGEALARRGWQVDMFTRRTHPDQVDVDKHYPGCRTIRLKAGPEAFIERDELFDSLPEFVNEFIRFQSKTNQMYPILHTNYWLSGWVGRKLCRHDNRQMVKQVHTYHSLGAVKYDSVDEIPAIAHTRLDIEKDCLETSDCIVATSPQERDQMQSLVSKKGNIKVIPCGTDIESFKGGDRQEARRVLGIDPDADMILYVGRFDPRKGIETLVRAIAHSTLRERSKLKLYIIGGSRPGRKDGEERKRIEAIVDELGVGDRVIFTGRVNHHADLPSYYTAADVCVVPSHYEPFGLVAIEAMASGTPVVASDVGGLKFTVVPEETGLRVPIGNADELAIAVNRLLSQPEWRSDLGKAGRNRVESNFSWDGVAGQLESLYQDLLGNLHQELFTASGQST